jgi:hypothetical protein
MRMGEKGENNWIKKQKRLQKKEMEQRKGRRKEGSSVREMRRT